jgi:hypothetical protein
MRLAAALLGVFCATQAWVYAQSSSQPVVLVVAADTESCFLSTGGTVSLMVQRGAKAILVRVTNDAKSAWKLSPEEAALRNRQEAEQAGKILGFQEVVSMGYRAHELADVPFTSLRDPILYIRHYPYRHLFRIHTLNTTAHSIYYSCAAECVALASIDNHVLPAQQAAQRSTSIAAPPLDPSCRESKAHICSATSDARYCERLCQKVASRESLKTINRAFAMQLGTLDAAVMSSAARHSR